MDGIEYRTELSSLLNVRVFDSCGPLRSIWEQFEQGHCYPFQSYACISTLLDTIGREVRAKPALVLVSDSSGTPVMLIPLALRRMAGMTVLEFIDFGPVDYNAPLIHPGFAGRLGEGQFAQIWQAILRQLGPIDLVRFLKMPEHIDGAANPVLQLGCHNQFNSYQAVLDGDFEGFMRKRSSKLMADSRRRRRRLGEQGRIEFRLAEEAEDIERFTDTMIRWKSRRYQETGARDMFVHQAYRDYYKRLAQAHGHRGGIVHLSALLLDGTPIAVHWGMHFRGRLYWIMPAFDREQWSQYAAGRLLLEDVIRWSYDEQVSIFDFTLGDEPFKLEWSERVMPLYAHEAGLSARGRAYLRCRAGITWLRQTVRKHPRLLVLAKRARSALSRRPRPELP